VQRRGEFHRRGGEPPPVLGSSTPKVGNSCGPSGNQNPVESHRKRGSWTCRYRTMALPGAGQGEAKGSGCAPAAGRSEQGLGMSRQDFREAPRGALGPPTSTSELRKRREGRRRLGARKSWRGDRACVARLRFPVFGPRLLPAVIRAVQEGGV
jgi:hypothetical protein